MRNVAVLMGGPSSEREVSLWSGARVLEALDRRRYRVLEVVIEQDGAWTIDRRRHDGALEGAAALRAAGCDVAFLALHGPFGEDGTIQGFLETAGLRYTGSGVAGSALAMDKVRAKRVAAAAGLDVARDLLAPPAGASEIEAGLGLPVFVKRPLGGSSLEVCRAATRAQLDDALVALRGEQDLLVEEAVAGRELTVAVLDDEHGRPFALPVTEIVSRGGYFDFENKYTPGVAREICPAELDGTIARRTQEAALEAHRALGLRELPCRRKRLRARAAQQQQRNPGPRRSASWRQLAELSAQFRCVRAAT
jgi:D-alanine-D-alanine ligase